MTDWKEGGREEERKEKEKRKSLYKGKSHKLNRHVQLGEKKCLGKI